MTINYDKLMTETSFKIIKEDDGFMAILLEGGELNESIIEYTNIDMLLEDSSIGLNFDYEIKSSEEHSFGDEDEKLKSFLTNILFSAISEQIGRDE